SNGPTIALTVDGKEPGEEIRFPASSRKRVRVQATLHTHIPVDKFEIVVNGTPVLTREAASSNQVVIDEEVPLDHSSWIAARGIGSCSMTSRRSRIPARYM